MTAPQSIQRAPGIPSTPPAEPAPLVFWVPLPGYSMNDLYEILWFQKRTQLKPAARVWKFKFKQAIRKPVPVPWTAQTKFRLAFDFHDQWYFKNGDYRELDVQNLVKLATDALAEALGFRDRQVWCDGPHWKIQSPDQVGIRATVWMLS